MDHSFLCMQDTSFWEAGAAVRHEATIFFLVNQHLFYLLVSTSAARSKAAECTAPREAVTMSCSGNKLSL